MPKSKKKRTYTPGMEDIERVFDLLDADQKRARWEEYQRKREEEKKKPNLKDTLSSEVGERPNKEGGVK